jgi:MoaA/NifB/PqqE/SkfB family radical SAM enzyme
MPWEVIQRTLHEVLPQCERRVDCTFTGGEPLLAMPMLRRAVEEGEALAARSGRRIRWKLLTNGVLLDDAVLDFLEAHEFSINLSFDGVEAAQQARGHGTFESLDRLLDRISREYALLWQGRLQVSMTLTPDNLPALSETVQYFLDKRLRKINMAPAMGRSGCAWALERIGELDAQFTRVSALMRRHVEQTGLAPLLIYRKFAPPRPAPRPLWMCLAYQVNGLTIDVDGSAYTCVLATSSYRRSPSDGLDRAVRALEVGRVGPGELGARRAALGRAIRRAGVFQHPEQRYSGYRRCQDCENIGRCQVCPIAAATEPGWADPRRVPDFLCAYNQVSIAHRDRFPCQPTILTLGA